MSQNTSLVNVKDFMNVYYVLKEEKLSGYPSPKHLMALCPYKVFITVY